MKIVENRAKTAKELDEELGKLDAQEVIAWGLQHYDNIAISFSGAEDVILVDMAVKTGEPFEVFSLDTGRLHPQTYRFLEQVRQHYGIAIDLISPEAEAVRRLVREKGLFSFYQDGHKECCTIRKVLPLKRKLDELDAWISGLRHDQSADTRSTIPIVQRDSAFSTATRDLLKFNPLVNWSSADIWHYIQKHEVPYNELHRQGFTSIGCEPCTRSILPNQHERTGRWWWENPDDKECGLHVAPPRQAQSG